jgi:hypothetical protein
MPPNSGPIKLLLGLVAIANGNSRDEANMKRAAAVFDGDRVSSSSFTQPKFVP